MRFCLTGQYPRDPGKIGGGVEFVLHLLAQTLAERPDIDLHLISPLRGASGMETMEIGNIKMHWVGTPKRAIVPHLLSDAPRLAKAFKQIHPDVANSHFSVTTNAAVIAGTPVAYTIHGVIHNEVAYSTGLGRLAHVLQAAVERKAILNATGIMSVAQYGIDECKQWIRVPSHVVPVPVPDEFFGAQPLEGAKDVLYAGVIHRRKNLMSFVMAMPAIVKASPDTILHVCGGVAQPDYMNAIQSVLAKHGLERNVKFHGVVDRRTLVGLLERSCCLVLPSFQETSPGVICQSMAAGRPAVASPAGGTKELIQDGENGFVVAPDDSQAMAQRVITLISNSKLAMGMGAAAREAALRRHERHAVADQIVDICRGLVVPNAVDCQMHSQGD